MQALKMDQNSVFIPDAERRSLSMEELRKQDRWAEEHIKLHEKHRGHEQMHLEMMIILVFTLIVTQIGLVQWKKYHFKSYQLCTMFGMWLIPIIVSVPRSWWRFIATWIIYSFVSCVVWYKSTRSQISGQTPRLVYKWFLFLHNMSYVFGIVGYFIIIFTLLGFGIIFNLPPNYLFDTGLLFLFYGLYYGVLGRDFAHVCTEQVATKIGYATPDGLPKRFLEDGVCAVCDNKFGINGSDEVEAVFRLSCGHIFHDFCIRGWCIIGKRQTCPYCKEKVDLKRMFKNPWEKPHLFYGQFLDWIRYLVAWQPLIITFVQAVNSYLGLE